MLRVSKRNGANEMLIVNYASKKELKTHIGEKLSYTETSAFGNEYVDNGSFAASNRPSINKNISSRSREFFAYIVMKDGLIHKVS